MYQSSKNNKMKKIIKPLAIILSILVAFFVGNYITRYGIVIGKDSDKYDEDALNELQVYSERLGGRNAIKILVATKQPVKKTVLDRAKEMNINIVILDKNIDIFKKVLIDLIKKKTV